MWDQIDLSTLSDQEHRVALFARQDPLRFATSPIAQIAEWTATSQATIIRTARSLGFSGTREMKKACARMVEQSRDLPGILRTRLMNLPAEDEVSGPRRLAHTVATDISRIVLQFTESLDPTLLAESINSLEKANRIVIYGLGTAFHIAEYAALELERIGVRAIALTGSGHTIADMMMRLDERDLLIIIAPRTIFADTNIVIKNAAPMAMETIVVSQDRPPTHSVHGKPIAHIPLPSTLNTSASESVCVWVLMDIFVADLARRDSTRAVKKRLEIERYRTAIRSGSK